MRRGTIELLFLIALISAAALRNAPAASRPGSPRMIMPCDSGWRFHLGDAPGAFEPGFDDRAWRTLDLPHDWSIELPFESKFASATGFLPGGIAWYRKTLDLTPSLAGKRLSIMFDGVYRDSEVWINGHSLGKRPNGYVSFEYDLTPFLKPDIRTNSVAVRVDHSAFADSRWYTGSGIYRHVWLIATEPVHVVPWGIFVTTPKVSATAATVDVKSRVKNESRQSRAVLLQSMIRDPNGTTIATLEAQRVLRPGEEYRFEQTVSIGAPKIWSPDHPDLYSMITRLRSENSPADEMATSFGIRTFSFDTDKGFILNGTRTALKGVCIHHDAGALGAAVPEAVLSRRLRLLKEMGCNAIRTSHNPPAPELLDMCDRMGFLVMDEAFDEWAKPKKKWIEGWNAGKPGLQGFAPFFDAWGIRDLQSMVERDKNHPCIILWSIGNEVDYEKDPYFDPESKDFTLDKPSAKELPPIAARLIKAVKDIDMTRPVTAALANITVSNRYGLADMLDVVGYNYLEKYYTPDHAAYPGRKFVGSENSHAYSAWKIVEDLIFPSGQFLWTGFDYLGEARQWPARSSSSGLLDECGFKKPAFYFRQSLWSEKPMVYIAARTPAEAGEGRATRAEIVPSWTWPGKDGVPVGVVVYTNCDSVEMFLNGTSLGEKPVSSAQDRVLSWEVPYSAGTLRAVGKKGNLPVTSWELRTSGKAARLQMKPEVTRISPAGSICHVEVFVTDDSGETVYSATDTIQFEVAGQGRILAVDSGDIRSHEDFRVPARKAYQGRCLVLLQSGSAAGRIVLKATAPGLRGDTILIENSAAMSRK
jgi:beta-galactosidase